MTKEQAEKLWEDVLNNGKGDNAIIKFNLKREEVKVFLAYTKPEMFVSEEINERSLREIRKLKQQMKKISNARKRKKSSNLMLNIMFVFSLIIVFPILALIGFIKYVL